MTGINAHTNETQATAQYVACAYVFQAPSGNWMVQDEMNRRGGIFMNRSAALKFVCAEFGREADIVERAPAAKPAAKQGHLVVLPGSQRRDVWDRDIHDISEGHGGKGVWETGAQVLIAHAGALRSA